MPTSGDGQSGAGGVGGSGGDPDSGGTGVASGWEEVRCWQNDTVRGCYARLGNLWAVVGPMCDVEGDPRESSRSHPTRSATDEPDLPL